MCVDSSQPSLTCWLFILITQYWYENGHLPEFQRYFELEEVADIKAPKYRDPELLPAWFQAYQCTKQQLEVCTYGV